MHVYIFSTCKLDLLNELSFIVLTTTSLGTQSHTVFVCGCLMSNDYIKMQWPVDSQFPTNIVTFPWQLATVSDKHCHIPMATGHSFPQTLSRSMWKLAPHSASVLLCDINIITWMLLDNDFNNIFLIFVRWMSFHVR